MKHRVNTKACRSQDDESDECSSSEPELVLFGGGDYRRATAATMRGLHGASYGNGYDSTGWRRGIGVAGRRGSAGFRLALEALKIGTHVGSVLVTQFAVFLQRLADDALEFGGQVRIHSDRCHRRAIENLTLDHS